jgi:hypothetical protein
MNRITYSRARSDTAQPEAEDLVQPHPVTGSLLGSGHDRVDPASLACLGPADFDTGSQVHG